MMEQLQKHLECIKEVDLELSELAEVRFQDAPFVLPDVQLVEARAAGTNVTTTANGFPLVLSTQLSLNRFEITGNRELTVTKVAKDKYNIQPKKISLGDKIEVKLMGKHIQGSPGVVYPTWSPNDTITVANNKIRASSSGAWGMIKEEFGMLPQSVTIRVGCECAWSQIALYDSPTTQFDDGNIGQRLAYHGITAEAPTISTFLWKLERENDGQVALYLNNTHLEEELTCLLYPGRHMV